MNTRQQDIVTLTEKHGEITIKELARILNVSEMTIHRDLDYLEKQKFLYKKRGAAVFIENPDRSNNNFYTDEKRNIGRKAASLIKPGQSILFDNSTTAIESAKYLDKKMHLAFYTTNLETADILSKYSNSILYCSGGYFFPDSKGFVGKQAEDFVKSVNADVCFIGTSGISVERGLTTPYPMHTALQKQIIASSSYRILLADHSKFGRNAMEHIAELSEIDLIITDSGISDEILETYRKYVNIIVAD